MKILVTGGAGFIGSNFIRHILAARRDCHVVNLDKLTYAGNLANLADIASDPRYHFVRGDICEAAVVAEAMKGCDAVVHFAAESHVDRSIYEPAAAVQTNFAGTFTLLRAAVQARIQRFVHVSTDEVYGDLPPGASADESWPIQPSSPYSATKAGSDCLVHSFVRTYGLPAMITRASNNYGPYQFPEKFIPLMVCNAVRGLPLPVYGDGLQERDWIHVEDHCRAIQAVLERAVPGEVYNIAGGNVETNISIVRRILNLLERPESLITHVADRPGHDRRYAMDSGKLKRELGWQPQVEFSAGLSRTVDWYRRNEAWVADVRDGAYMQYYERFYVNRVQSLSAIGAAAND